MATKKLKMATTFGTVTVDIEADKISFPKIGNDYGHLALGNVKAVFSHRNKSVTLYLPGLYVEDFSERRPSHGESRIKLAQYASPMFSVRDGRGNPPYAMFNDGGAFMPLEANLKAHWGNRPS